MILETSFLIDLMKGRSEAVTLADEIDRSGESVYLPAPALFELWLGAGRSARGKEEIRKIETLIESFDVIVMPHEDAREAGLLQARPSKGGRTMGIVDVLLAGMARRRGEVLVTGERDFSTVRREVRLRSYRRGR
jgi:tRNA(fMet)-specific endonuclease VapC